MRHCITLTSDSVITWCSLSIPVCINTWFSYKPWVCITLDIRTINKNKSLNVWPTLIQYDFILINSIWKDFIIKYSHMIFWVDLNLRGYFIPEYLVPLFFFEAKQPYSNRFYDNYFFSPQPSESLFYQKKANMKKW